MTKWIDACSINDIEREDLIGFEHEGVDYALYRSPSDEYFATSGVCTHQFQLLCEGFVMGNVIECPKHNGRFNYRTGAALGAPVLEPLRTFPTRIDGERLLIDIDGIE